MRIHIPKFKGPQNCSPSSNKKCCSAAKSLQSCPTLCDPTDGSLPGSSVHGIFQARVLEWVATAFSIKDANCTLTSPIQVNRSILEFLPITGIF